MSLTKRLEPEKVFEIKPSPPLQDGRDAKGIPSAETSVLGNKLNVNSLHKPEYCPAPKEMLPDNQIIRSMMWFSVNTSAKLPCGSLHFTDFRCPYANKPHVYTRHPGMQPL